MVESDDEDFEDDDAPFGDDLEDDDAAFGDDQVPPKKSRKKARKARWTTKKSAHSTKGLKKRKNKSLEDLIAIEEGDEET